MKENLSQLNSYGHELTTNNTNLAKNLELLKAVMETLASNLNATSKNISSQTDELTKQIVERFCNSIFLTTCLFVVCVISQGKIRVLLAGYGL